MILKLRSIIFLLAFALLIQNTCLHGFAGKTAVTPVCANCPMKHNLMASPDGQDKIVSDSPSTHFPLFVFAVLKAVHTFQLEPITSSRPVLSDYYQDALPDELLRPPRA
jgi:hypothetical protein